MSKTPNVNQALEHLAKAMQVLPAVMMPDLRPDRVDFDPANGVWAGNKVSTTLVKPLPERAKDRRPPSKMNVEGIEAMGEQPVRRPWRPLPPPSDETLAAAALLNEQALALLPAPPYAPGPAVPGESRRHVAEIGQYEYFTDDAGNLYCAPLANPIGKDGIRMGARWCCASSAAKRYVKRMRENLTASYGLR